MINHLSTGIWGSDRFHGFVPADLADAHRALVALRDRASSFVELGSGAGTGGRQGPEVAREAIETAELVTIRSMACPLMT